MMLAAALILERLVGDPQTKWHPVALFGALASRIERAVFADRRLMGMMAWLLAMVPAALLLSVFIYIARDLDPWLEGAIGAVLIWSTVGWRSLLEHVGAVQRAHATSDARKALARIVGRDVDALQPHEIRAAALESLAENASDAVVAPLFWAVVGGPVAAVVYRMINTLDAMWGHRSGRYRHFGWTAARSDDLANWIPARLTALFYLLVAMPFRPALVSQIAIEARGHPSVNAGWPESALAHVLRVRLGGPVHRGKRIERRAWMGPAGAPVPGAYALHRGLRVTQRALVLATVCAMAAGGLGR